MIVIAWAGRFFTSSSLLAPKYWEIIEEMAERDWPKTQINIDKKEETIPTAARDSVALFGMCPTMAASVNERIGSEIPAIMAGTANALICLFVMVVIKEE